MRLSITAKLIALTACMVVLTALAVNEVYSSGSNHILVDEAIAALKNETQFIKYPLDGRIGQLKDDTRLLAQLSASGPTAAQELLAATANEMLRTRTYYTDIRFIGSNDATPSFAIAAANGALQRLPANGDDMPVVQAALQAAAGAIVLAEPELAKRQGVAIKPYLLTLRAAMKLPERNGHSPGVVIISMDLGRILADIRQQLAARHTLYISNSNGDYLLNPDPAKLYGSELGQPARLQKDYPAVLTAMDDAKLDDVAFLSDETADGNALAFLEDHYDPLNPEHYIGIAVETPYRNILAQTRQMEQRGFAFSSAIALIAIAACILLLRRLLRPLAGVADAIVRYRKGEKDIKLPVDSPDEIGVLAGSFQAMMQQKNDEDWVKETLVSISRQLLGFKELPAFSVLLLSALTQAMGAQIGMLYISARYTRQNMDMDNDALLLTGTCGYPDLAALPGRFRLGEGLVGHCAQSQRPRLLHDVPDEYAHIASATGNAKPRQLLLMPVLFEATTVGVIELAALQPFSDIQQRFLAELCFTIGVIITGISAGARTEELLEEARATAEELQKSEEELRVQQEELQASNEEMEEKTRTLEEQNARIRQQSQTLVENQQQLERANRYKSEFLANMSHELRTPLNSLLILARSLSANEEGNLNAEQVEEAQIIHNGGLELLRLINDILDLSKVEAGKMSVQMDYHPLADIIGKLKRQFEPLAREARLDFTVSMENGLPAELYSDGQRFEQIMKNLLANAFKFTRHGAVTLDVRRAGERDGFLAFSVTDTGIGIEPSKLKDIFEAFQQEDGSTDRHYGGTGLGLTIARKFAWLLGGEIRVDSRKGVGSTFTLLLPVQADAAGHRPPAVEAGTPAPLAGAKRLLIIEDDTKFAAILGKIARARGFDTLLAANGKDGLELAAQRAVSAIILDLRLPDMDGLDVLEQLKANPRTQGIAVHIISGRDQGDIEGAAGYTRKPLNQEAIETILGQIESAVPAQSRKLLVVEDDKNTQTAIQRLLKKKTLDMTFSSSGGDALSLLAQQAFDCIILDLSLPDMDGFSWLDAAEKQAGEDALPPVIVYTSKELSEDEHRRLARHTGSVVIKGSSSLERLIDEVTLFIHSVDARLPARLPTIIPPYSGRPVPGRTLLLVDDDLRNVFAIGKLLKKQGLHVLVADNGEMALAMLAQHPAINLVIMDIMMPVMDGYQAIREIRKNDAWRTLPIIALTARAMPDEEQKCLQCGANDYLSKPVDTDQLFNLISVLLLKRESGQ